MPYNTPLQLTDYAAERGITLVSSPAVLLVKAHDFVDSKEFVGSKTDPLQPNEWPRTGVYLNGILIPDTEIPNRSGGGSILNMELETAIAIDQSNDLFTDNSQQIKSTSEKVGPITESIEYFENTKITEPKSIKNAAYKLLVSNGRGANFRVSNA